MSVLERLRSMDADELRFRLACEARKAAGLVRATVSSPQWRRSGLVKALRPLGPGDSAALAAARRALSSSDFSAAQRELALHFAARKPHFPLDPRSLDALAERIRRRFPEASNDARRRADRILNGQYDLLGYEGIPFGASPRWHSDPVHGREAPKGYWSGVRYLDPAAGDHKIIWEINRHQHWLQLARAFHLTGDRRYYRAVADQLESWMTENPPLQGINWASMLELGLRTISWAWALHFLAAAARQERDESPWIVDLLLGIDGQLQHVEDNLSRYFSPNTHLLGEALALYVVGSALPELRASARRMTLGRRVLLEELDRQVNADGGHVELSAHYHRYTTDFYLLALLTARVIGDPALPKFQTGVRRLAAYLRTIADDHGQLPLLGDDDGGQLFPVCGRPAADCRDTLGAAAAILGDTSLLVSDIPEEVFWLCGTSPLEDLERRRVPWPSTPLTQSGYYVSRSACGDHLVFDAGRHGFLNGGHAHADALSLVLTVGGQPLLVDSGTATYTMEPARRDRFRSTSMHNTVVLNGRSQSEPRGPFHWRTTADARCPLWLSQPDFDYVEGHHAAYAPVVHSRSVLAVHGFGWLVIDHLLGDGAAEAEAFWHLHPSWAPLAHPHGVTVRHRSGSLLSIAASVPLEILAASSANGLDAYAPVYGLVERGTCLRARSAGPLPRSFATFITRDRGTATRSDTEVAVAECDVTEPLPHGWHGAAFRVSLAGQQAIVLAAVERSPAETTTGPAAVWGCAAARTDARVALCYLNGTDAPPVLVQGTRVDRAGLVRA